MLGFEVHNSAIDIVEYKEYVTVCDERRNNEEV